MTVHRIEVAEGPAISAVEGVKLVNALEGAGVDVSHRCGGNARCTTCRVTLDQDVPMGDAERQCLEEDGVLGQFRLSCQIVVDRDLKVEVLMSAAAQGWTPGPTVDP